MKTLFENLNDGAFVATRDENGELLIGFYHDVFYKGSDETLRMFEPIAPFDIFTTAQIMNYIKAAK